MIDETPEEVRLRMIFREELDIDRRLLALEDIQGRQRKMLDDLQGAVHGGPASKISKPGMTRITDPGGTPSALPPWYVTLLSEHAKLIIVLLFVVIFLLALVGQLDKIASVVRGAGH